MTTLHEAGDGKISFTKGSPDEILVRCRYVWSNGKTAVFSAAAREQAKRGLAEMTEAGLRVLAIGMHPKAAQMEESGLTFLGMAGMEDPVRPEAAEAGGTVCTCRSPDDHDYRGQGGHGACD